MMPRDETIAWLLEGDVSIQYQVYKDLLGQDREDLQSRIAQEGWGEQFLSKRKPEGHWGKRFYEPKWISSHYTLLDLKNLQVHPDQPLIKESINLILNKEKSPDGGVGPFGQSPKSDVCVNGMFLSYASFFKAGEKELESVIDFLLKEKMQDGGFNCRSNRSGAKHSSLHSTISVLEGFNEYLNNGYTYRRKEIASSQESGNQFILMHRLFKSDRTGKIINKDFLKFPYPPRWRYDILRALDYFQSAKVSWDDRMKDAVEILLDKQNKAGTWNHYAGYPGQVHFEMEKAAKPGRWNTLRALRVLKHFNL